MSLCAPSACHSAAGTHEFPKWETVKGISISFLFLIGSRFVLSEAISQLIIHTYRITLICYPSSQYDEYDYPKMISLESLCDFCLNLTKWKSQKKWKMNKKYINPEERFTNSMAIHPAVFKDMSVTIKNAILLKTIEEKLQILHSSTSGDHKSIQCFLPYNISMWTSVLDWAIC